MCGIEAKQADILGFCCGMGFALLATLCAYSDGDYLTIA